MTKFSGIPVSAGIASGKAFLYLEGDFPEITMYSVEKKQRGAEISRFHAAVARAAAEVQELKKKAEKEMSREHAAILGAHLMMLDDPEFHEQILGKFEETGLNMEWVVYDAARAMMEKMMASPDPVFRERAVDINDVSRRLIYKLLDVSRMSLAELTKDVIIVARDLLPSELLTMRRERVKGFVLDTGGKTSHTAILARAFGIPAVLGVSTATKTINNDDTLIVDGDNGHVYVNPDNKTFSAYRQSASGNKKRSAEFAAMKDLPAETKDGRRVSLEANIELPEEAGETLKFGAEGIGLYRSEFLFLTPGKSADEETQFQSYRTVLEAFGELPVTVRTVDIGGDKILPDFHDISDERNPLLGWRAIRFSLALPDIFKTQLRALLRASVHGHLRILFPLISGVEELEQALVLLEEAKEECRKKQQSFADNIETGVMIEVPSAAVTADILAEKAGFFSIGTNDLIQYAIAVDRGNGKVNYLAQPCHPAVLRLIKRTIDAAHGKGLRAAMCGEMAGDPAYTAALLGLGLDSFSMAAASIPKVKRVVRSVTLEDCKTLAQDLLSGRGWHENAALVNSWTSDRGL